MLKICLFPDLRGYHIAIQLYALCDTYHYIHSRNFRTGLIATLLLNKTSRPIFIWTIIRTIINHVVLTPITTFRFLIHISPTPQIFGATTIIPSCGLHAITKRIILGPVAINDDRIPNYSLTPR